MDEEQYDQMLQEMTLALREIYENAYERPLIMMETQALNDTLDMFFGDRK